MNPVSSFLFNWAWKSISHLQIVKTIPKFHSFCRKLNIFHGCQSESSTISCRVMRQCRQIVLKRATGGRFLTTPIRCPNKHESFAILLWIANFPSVGDTKPLCAIFTILVPFSRDNALFTSKAKINVFERLKSTFFEIFSSLRWPLRSRSVLKKFKKRWF